MITEVTSTERFSSFPMPSPIASKINAEHIDKILENADKDNQRIFEDNKSDRVYTLIYTLIFVALLIFLTIFLVEDHQNLLLEIGKILAILGGGFGAGYGYKVFKDKD